MARRSNKSLRAKGVKIETASVERDLREIAFNARVQARDIARESLEGMIKAIQSKTANRRTFAKQFRSISWRLGRGTQDNPLQGAKVVSRSGRDSKDTRRGRLILYVEHKTKNVRPKIATNLFDVLDAGTRDRIATRRHRRPVADKSMFPDSFDPAAFADPTRADGEIDTASIEMVKIRPSKRQGGAKTGWKVPHIVTINRGDSIPGISPKHLYWGAATYTKSELLKRGIVNKNRRTKVKLKHGDIIVGVSSGRRFTKV